MFEKVFYDTCSFERTEEGFRAEVELRIDHPVYAGHFPGQPVVPGAYTLRMLRELTERAVGCALYFDTMREAKFTSMLVPSEGLRVEVEATLHEKVVRAVVRRADEPVLKLQATWEKE